MLHLYTEGDGGEVRATLYPQKGEQGLWSFEPDLKLDGVYYEYEVTVDGVSRRTTDPYAKACGLNGSRSMVIDLRRTGPEGWQEDRAPEEKPEHVIY